MNNPEKKKDPRGRKALPDEMKKVQVQVMIENFKVRALGGYEATQSAIESMVNIEYNRLKSS